MWILTDNSSCHFFPIIQSFLDYYNEVIIRHAMIFIMYYMFPVFLCQEYLCVSAQFPLISPLEESGYPDHLFLHTKQPLSCRHLVIIFPLVIPTMTKTLKYLRRISREKN